MGFGMNEKKRTLIYVYQKFNYIVEKGCKEKQNIQLKYFFDIKFETKLIIFFDKI